MTVTVPGRLVFVAVVVGALLGLAACGGASQAEADATERETCAAVERLGQIVDAFLTGDVRPGDAESLDELARRAHAVRRAAATTDNGVLVSAGSRVSVVASALAQRPTGRSRTNEESPDAMVNAFRTLEEKCRSLGVAPLAHS